jgi:hypothetical protein
MYALQILFGQLRDVDAVLVLPESMRESDDVDADDDDRDGARVLPAFYATLVRKSATSAAAFDSEQRR